MVEQLELFELTAMKLNSYRCRTFK